MSIGSSPSFTEIYTAINGSWPAGTQISLDTHFRNVPFTDGGSTNSSSGAQLSLSQFRNKTILRDYIVGSGTSRTDYYPCYSWYNMSDTCTIYRNEELAAIGLDGASIGSVAWEFRSNSSTVTTDRRANIKIYLANIIDTAGAPKATGYRDLDYSSSVTDTYGSRTYQGLDWRPVYDGAYNIPNVYDNPQWINFNFGIGPDTDMEFFHEPGKSLAISCYSPYEAYISNGRSVSSLGNGEPKLSSHYYVDQDYNDPNTKFGNTMGSSNYRPKVKFGNIGLGFGGRLIGGGDFR